MNNIKLSIETITTCDTRYNWQGKEIRNNEFTRYVIVATMKFFKWFPIKQKFYLQFDDDTYQWMRPHLLNTIKDGKEVLVTFIGKDVRNAIHHCTTFKNKEWACTIIELMHQKPNQFLLP